VPRINILYRSIDENAVRNQIHLFIVIGNKLLIEKQKKSRMLFAQIYEEEKKTKKKLDLENCFLLNKKKLIKKIKQKTNKDDEINVYVLNLIYLE